MGGSSPVQKRQRAYRRGLDAERLCVLSLRARGYRILARRYRCGVGEIDIVARRGKVIAAIEVKARDSAAGALSSVTQRQQQRITRAAEQFLACHPQLARCDWRFDVMWVTAERSRIRSWRRILPQHLTDAWRV